jgi:hypothetical protein
VADPLEGELDRLFQLPPGELVEARNALADRLRKAGDKAGAAQAKAIKRAAPVAWALNQLWFTQPALLERARAQADELRGLQAQRGGDPRRLAAALEQQRNATQAVIDAALRAWRSAGLSESGLSERKLFTTVQAWLSGKGEERPGRMTVEIEASGFDAFAGVTLTAPPVSAQAGIGSSASTDAPAAIGAGGVAAARPEQPAKRGPDPVALERASKRLAEREQLAATARQRARSARDEQAAARQAREDAQVAVREAERRAAELRTVLEKHELALQRCSAELEAAQREQASADEAVAAARDELTAVQASSA